MLSFNKEALLPEVITGLIPQSPSQPIPKYNNNSIGVYKTLGELEMEAKQEIKQPKLYSFLQNSYKIIQHGYFLNDFAKQPDVNIRRLILLVYGKYPGFPKLEDRCISEEFIEKIFEIHKVFHDQKGPLPQSMLQQISKDFGIDYVSAKNIFGEGKEIFSLFFSDKNVFPREAYKNILLHCKVYHRLLAGQDITSIIEEVDGKSEIILKIVNQLLEDTLFKQKTSQKNDLVPLCHVFRDERPPLELGLYTLFLAKEGVPKKLIGEILDGLHDWMIIRILHGRYQLSDYIREPEEEILYNLP
ncbi:MAG: hypothetical protein LBE20_01025 [Deltaproteobacteria bacterium]|jgi:hypothetical protein|nr:hypothetical protein [Deltaproteobacteria bacterium]